MWSVTSDLFPSPTPTQGVAPRKGGGMLQAAIDSYQANSAPLTQILMDPAQNLPDKSRVVRLEEGGGDHCELPLQLQQQRDPRAAGSVGSPKQTRIELEGRGQGRGGVAKVCLGRCYNVSVCMHVCYCTVGRFDENRENCDLLLLIHFPRFRLS